MRNDAQQFAELVASLYDSVVDPNGWTSMASRIAQWFGVDSCGLNHCGVDRQLIERLSQTNNYSPNMTVAYRDYFFNLDPWIKQSFNSPLELTLNSSHYVVDQDMADSEFYTDFLKHTGNNFYCLSQMIPISARNTVATIGLHRTRKQGPFNDSDLHRLNVLVPHYRRALQLREQLGSVALVSTICETALTRLNIGALITDHTARLLYANPLASSLLQRSNGLRCRNGLLSTEVHPQTALLQQTIREAAFSSTGSSHSAGKTLMIVRKEEMPMALAVYPLPRALDFFGSVQAAIIFIGNRAETYHSIAENFARLHALTPAEAQWVNALLAGYSLQDYANLHALSIHTAKALLKRVLHKTGHASQSDLVLGMLVDPILRLS